MVQDGGQWATLSKSGNPRKSRIGTPGAVEFEKNILAIILVQYFQRGPLTLPPAPPHQQLAEPNRNGRFVEQLQRQSCALLHTSQQQTNSRVEVSVMKTSCERDTMDAYGQVSFYSGSK
jgi:hypothetical protein